MGGSIDLWDLTTIGQGLPVAASADAILDAVRTGVAIIEAPPGTGNTTWRV